jgi:hypothetical protein
LTRASKKARMSDSIIIAIKVDLSHLKLKLKNPILIVQRRFFLRLEDLFFWDIIWSFYSAPTG